MLTRSSEWFQTQLGSRYVGGKLDSSTGGNNCGPASLSMAITYWRLRGATRIDQPITPLDAANEVRGGSAKNGPDNETTDFGLADYETSKESRELLDRYGLELARINTLDDVEVELSHGDPVILLVKNSKYRDEDPYGKGASAGFFGYWKDEDHKVWVNSSHIIVVTGIDGDTVHVGDPLAKGPIEIPLSKLVEAANAASSVDHWYGAGVRPSTHEVQVAQPQQTASTPTGQGGPEHGRCIRSGRDPRPVPCTSRRLVRNAPASEPVVRRTTGMLGSTRSIVLVCGT